MKFFEAKEGLRWQIIKIVVVLLMGGCLLGILGRLNDMEATARVINYAGLVRGGTQRLIKLESNGIVSDDLLHKIDSYLAQLQTGRGSEGLKRLDDAVYQSHLEKLATSWIALRAEIKDFRENGNKAKLLKLSEMNFYEADLTVAAAENVGHQQARALEHIEACLALLILLCFVQLVYDAIRAMLLNKKVEKLNKLAYTDGTTELPNKESCLKLVEEHPTPESCRGMATLVLDLNDLKGVNDTLGHKLGDAYIFSFAQALRNALPADGFLSRWGGDEFVIVLKQASAASVQAFLQRLEREVKLVNDKNQNVHITYAQGIAFADEHPSLNLKQLLTMADHAMYSCKRDMKTKNN